MSSDQGKLNSMKVEIQSTKWIKPATPTPSHLHKHQLSCIDQLVPPLYAQPIFYFDITRETTDQVQTSGRLQLQLEESLSKVLTLYYPFAGRIYDEDDFLVSCQDQGVAFVVAKADRKLDEYLADGEYDSKVLFSSLESLQTSNPLMMVQVNIFTCGGLAIGLGINHKLCDMFTISSFMNAWATTCRLGSLDKVIRPSFSFLPLLPPIDDLQYFTKKLLSNSDKSPPSGMETDTVHPKYVMRRCVFTREAIAKIRSSIVSTDESYTRVELVIALIARSFTNIERFKGTPPKPLVIHQPMNFRSRTGLHIEENSCGNLCTGVMANCGQLDHNGLMSWELRELAKCIKNSVKKAAAEMSKVREWRELSDKVVKEALEIYEEMKKGETVNRMSFSCWCRFPLYEVDFGWGRPTLVSHVPVPRCIYLMDCKSDVGGVEALVCFKEQDMASFLQQPDILEYASFL